MYSSMRTHVAIKLPANTQTLRYSSMDIELGWRLLRLPIGRELLSMGAIKAVLGRY